MVYFLSGAPRREYGVSHALAALVGTQRFFSTEPSPDALDMESVPRLSRCLLSVNLAVALAILPLDFDVFWSMSTHRFSEPLRLRHRRDPEEWDDGFSCAGSRQALCAFDRSPTRRSQGPESPATHRLLGRRCYRARPAPASRAAGGPHLGIECTAGTWCPTVRVPRNRCAARLLVQVTCWPPRDSASVTEWCPS
jgi:hypothetical protein